MLCGMVVAAHVQHNLFNNTSHLAEWPDFFSQDVILEHILQLAAAAGAGGRLQCLQSLTQSGSTSAGLAIDCSPCHPNCSSLTGSL